MKIIGNSLTGVRVEFQNIDTLSLQKYTHTTHKADDSMRKGEKKLWKFRQSFVTQKQDTQFLFFLPEGNARTRSLTHDFLPN